MPGIRSFIAVDVVEEDVLKRIQAVQRDLVATGADLKIVEPQNIHFTLHFLGEVNPSRIPELVEILEEVDMPSFDVELEGLRCFRPSRPRVIWIGVTQGAEQLIRLQGFLAARLRQHRFPVERRKYSPHITVARVRSGANRSRLVHLLQQLDKHNFGQIRVTTVKLKKSTLTPRGPIYEDLKVKPLVAQTPSETPET